FGRPHRRPQYWREGQRLVVHLGHARAVPQRRRHTEPEQGGALPDEAGSAGEIAISLEPGVRLGPYEIVAPLGAGGMGEVYRARDTRLNRTVAIKVLSEKSVNDPRFRERFEREAKAISALDHPHICALYDVGEHDGSPFIVMQCLDGETLEQRLRTGP